MPKILLKDVFVEIRHSLGRFLSILLIVALGVAFYGGIKASAPDMKASADAHFDNSNTQDIQVYSTLGMRKDDLEAIEKLPGVSGAMGQFTIDALMRLGTKEQVVKVISWSPDQEISQPRLIDGRMPEAEDECLLQAPSVTSELGGSLEIGDTVQLYSGTDTPLSDDLNITSFKIVGLAYDPNYLSYELGTSSIGSGSVDTFIYVMQDAIKADYYTEIDVTVAGAKDINTYSDAYFSLTDPVVTAIEDLATTQLDDRIASLQKELDDQKADAQKELDDAKAKLDDAKAELDDGRTQLEDGEKQLEDSKAQLADAASQIAEGKAELADAASQIQSGAAEIASSEQTLASSKSQLDSGWSTYYSSLNEVQDGENQITAGQSQLTDGLNQVESGLSQIADGQNQIKDGITQIDDGLNQIASAQAQLPELQAQLASLENAKSSLASLENAKAGLEQLEATRQSLQSQLDSLQAYDPENEQIPVLQASLDQVNAQIASIASSFGASDGAGALNIINSSIQQIYASAGDAGTIDSLISQVQDGIAQIQALDSQKADLEAQKSDLEAQNASLEEQKASLEATKSELLDQQSQLDAKASELAAAKATLASSYNTLVSSQEQYDSGLSQIQSAKDQLAQAQAEYNSGAATLADSEAQYQDGLSQLAQGEAELEENRQTYEDGLKEYEDGLKEYTDQKEKADSEIADAQQTIDDLDPEWIVLDRDSHYSYRDYESCADRMDGIASVFPVFFFLVAALVCMTTMTRMVAEQRTEIGTLKALGYSKGQIAFKYLMYAGLASVAGCVLGCAVGMIIFPYIIFYAWNTMYNLETLVYLFPIDLILQASLSVTGIVLLATLYSIFRELMEVPSQLMRPKAGKAGKKIVLERIPWLWNRFSFMHKVTLRNLFRDKKRFFMTVIGIAGCSALLVSGFGLNDSISDIVPRQFEEIYHYDATVTAGGEADTIEEELLDLDGVDAVYRQQILSVVINFDKKDITAYLNIIEDPDSFGEFMTFYPMNGSPSDMQLDDSGVFISIKTAEKMDLAIGDTIHFETSEGQELEAPVTGIFDQYIDHQIYVTQDLFDTWDVEDTPSSSYLLINDSTDEDYEDELGAEIMNLDGVSSVTFYSALAQNFLDMISAIKSVVVVLVVSAALLAFVVLYNLSNVNISERMREIATIKVLGFTEKETNQYINRETLILSAIGAVLGLFVGIYLHSMIMSLAELDTIRFGRTILWSSFVISLVLTMVFTLAINWIMKFKLRKIQMVESLKAVE